MEERAPQVYRGNSQKRSMAEGMKVSQTEKEERGHRGDQPLQGRLWAKPPGSGLIKSHPP